ncbi:hypothetical protein NUM3379_23830 [Kineococcus sp. NUM-3379]
MTGQRWTGGDARQAATGGSRFFPAAVAVLLAWAAGQLLLPPLPAALLGLAPAVLMALGPRVHRPRTWQPWALMATTLALATTGNLLAVAGAGTGELARACTIASRVGGALVIGWVLLDVLRRPRTDRDRSTSAWLDSAMLAAVVALVVVQALLPGLRGGAVSAQDVAMAVYLLLLGVVLRFVIVSAAASPATAMLQLCGVVAIAHSLLEGVLDRWSGSSQDFPTPLGMALMALMALAAAHPSMATAFETASLGQRRQASAQMLALLPLVALPPALWLLGETRAVTLPTWAYLLAGGLVSALGLVRGILALRVTERRAARDPLTDLLNRRGLAESFATRRQRAGDGPGWVLCVLDVDDFKHVNDTYGHDDGDALVLEVSRRLVQAVGPADAVGRTGGDEFVLLCATGPGAATPEEVLRAVFGVPFTLAGRPLHVHASMGIVPVRECSTLLQLLADADVAMYSVKAAGGDGTAVFTDELRRQVLGRRALVEDLRAVLAGEDPERVGRLGVVYQPLVDMGTGRVLSCEALVRWEHPQRGRVMPDDFLSAAEDHGLGAEVDRVVLRTALAELGRWDGWGLPPLSVSVNLGRSSTCDPALALTVLDALAEAELPASRLHLEITEHEHLPDDPAIAEAFRSLVAAGVGLSLDDFGAGYASLDYLLRYPVSTLKLDRCITAPLIDDAESPLLEGVVGLAARLNLTVLAEGVETAEQRTRLADLGIGHGQGWFFARPLPGEDFARHVLRETAAQLGPARA